jgi:carbon-monoxide dehydrogenase large subunit
MDEAEQELRRLLTGAAAFTDYAIPKAYDLPPIAVIAQSVPAPFNLLGAKGVGEAGTIQSLCAVHAAVADALEGAGAAVPAMPFTPYALWRALRS